MPTSPTTNSIDIDKTTVAIDSRVTKLFEYLTSISGKYDTTLLPEMEVTTLFSVKSSSETSFSAMDSATSISHESTTFKDKDLLPVEIDSTAAPTSKFSGINVTSIISPVTREYELTSSSSERLGSTVTVPALPQGLSSTVKTETQDQSSSLPHGSSSYGSTSIDSSTESTLVSMKTVGEVEGEIPLKTSSETSKKFTTSATQER
jgi:hypothetical protein